MDRIDPTFALILAGFLFGWWLRTVFIDLRRKKLINDLSRLQGMEFVEIYEMRLGKWVPASIRSLEWMVRELETN